jgi:hypothetical protein
MGEHCAVEDREKSDEVVVPRKRSKRGTRLPADIVEGRASPGGTATGGCGSDTEPTCQVNPIDGSAPEGMRVHPQADARHEGQTRRVSSARRVLRGDGE